MLEILYVAMKKNAPDDKVMEIVKDLAKKKFKGPYLVGEVMDVVGQQEAARLDNLTKTRVKRR